MGDNNDPEVCPDAPMGKPPPLREAFEPVGDSLITAPLQSRLG